MRSLVSLSLGLCLTSALANSEPVKVDFVRKFVPKIGKRSDDGDVSVTLLNREYHARYL